MPNAVRRPGALLCVVLLAALPASAQTVVVQTDAAGGATQAVYPEDALVASVTLGDSLAARAAFAPNEAVDLIVQFEAPPYSVAAEGPLEAAKAGRIAAAEAAKAGRIAAAEAAMQRERRQFEADLAALDAVARQGGPLEPAAARLRFDYRRTFNGVALTIRRWAASDLAALPYVRRVFPDARVETLDEESNRIIGADRVWQDFGATGEGVLLAIVDTGIDYTHPDLGGGFGPGAKVAGGYDFVDDDADPMDENGHGTHVAGIAAADGGTLQGVAPKARLLAVRVIGADGLGLASAVIAGIEYAVDPDGNPATDDYADVMNLSLGGPGSPADPMSQAIDNAVRSGVVCVVASGNTADYRSVRSPGTAAEALTVGATTLDDQIAFFNSKGPTDLAFTNKPDLVAPGVGIRSTVPGGGYQRLNGTSMAAPHAAGAAALLLALHPRWEPEMVKAALVQSATDLATDLWTQGAGRLDVFAAAQRQVLATPTTISLGLLDLSQPTRTHAETLTLYNRSNQTQTFDLSVGGDHPPGLAATLTPNRITVAPGQRGTVDFSVVINTAQVPFAPILPPPYVGRILVQSAVGSTTIPFTFLKAPHLALSFDDGPPLFLLIHNGTSNAVLLEMDALWGADTIAVPLASGDYDLVSVFVPLDPAPPRFYVTFDVRERLSVTHTTKAAPSWKRGVNTVGYRLSDVDGNDLQPDVTFARLVFEDEAITMGVGGTLRYDHLALSDVGDRYALNMAFHTLTHPSGADYVIPFGLGPGHARTTTTLRNNPAAFKRVDTRVNAAPGTDALLFGQAVYATATGPTPRRTFFFSQALRAHYLLLPPFQRTVYYGSDAPPGSAYRFQNVQIFDAMARGEPAFPDPNALLLFDSMILEITSGRVTGRRALDGSSRLFVTPAPAIEETMGLAPPYWMGQLTKVPPKPPRGTPSMGLEPAPLGALFAHPGGDVRPGRVAVQFFADGTLLDERTWPNALPLAMLTFKDLASQSSYEMLFTFDDYHVQGLAGKATARLRFLFRENPNADSAPPTLEIFQLKADGRLTDVFPADADNRIVFVARDVDARGDLGPVASAELFYHRLGEDAAWQPLTLARNGDTFTAAWPPGMPDGYYALRVLTRDAAGHTLDYAADPALRVGGRTTENNAPPAPFALLAPEDGVLLDSLATRAAIPFRWQASSDADGDALRYTLTLSGPGLDTTLAIGPATTLDFEALARLEGGATYAWTVYASDGFAVTFASRPFTFRTEGTRTPVEATPALPREVTLAQNYPNPFHPSTTLAFALPAGGAVRLEVFNVLGRRVALLVDGVLPAGRHTAVWEAREAPSGVYLYRLAAGNTVRTRRMLLVR